VTSDELTKRANVSSRSGSQQPGSDPSRVFTHPVRIYWEDTDAGGIVYYANYLKFMERARTEWLRALGIEQEVLHTEQRLMFVVVHADVGFRKPARYGDSLQVTCELAERGRASLTFRQRIVRAATEELLVEGTVRIACLDADKFKPRGLPDQVLQRMSEGVN
jgi:acyl-CoA thioester hydrolase